MAVKQKILIVDDDSNITDLLQVNLRSKGYSVEVVKVAETVDRTAQDSTNLVIVDAMNQPYSGWVTVGFDNPLFFVDNGVKKQVVDTSSDSIGLTGNYVSSSVTCTLPGNIELRPMYSDNTFRPCQSLRFYVSNAYQGAAITFDQFLANENGDYGTDGLVLKLDIQALAPGQYGAVFTIDTAGWDGR